MKCFQSNNFQKNLQNICYKSLDTAAWPGTLILLLCYLVSGDVQVVIIYHGSGEKKTWTPDKMYIGCSVTFGLLVTGIYIHGATFCEATMWHRVLLKVLYEYMWLSSWTFISFLLQVHFVVLSNSHWYLHSITLFHTPSHSCHRSPPFLSSVETVLLWLITIAYSFRGVILPSNTWLTTDSKWAKCSYRKMKKKNKKNDH